MPSMLCRYIFSGGITGRIPLSISQVLHFLTEPEVHTAFDTFHSLLKPGGKLLVVANTPYLGWFSTELIEKNRQDVEEWKSRGMDAPLPGFFPRVRDLIKVELTAVPAWGQGSSWRTTPSSRRIASSSTKM